MKTSFLRLKSGTGAISALVLSAMFVQFDAVAQTGLVLQEKADATPDFVGIDGSRYEYGKDNYSIKPFGSDKQEDVKPSEVEDFVTKQIKAAEQASNDFKANIKKCEDISGKFLYKDGECNYLAITDGVCSLEGSAMEEGACASKILTSNTDLTSNIKGLNEKKNTADGSVKEYKELLRKAGLGIGDLAERNIYPAKTVYTEKPADGKCPEKAVEKEVISWKDGKVESICIGSGEKKLSDLIKVSDGLLDNTMWNRFKVGTHHYWNATKGACSNGFEWVRGHLDWKTAGVGAVTLAGAYGLYRFISNRFFAGKADKLNKPVSLNRSRAQNTTQKSADNAKNLNRIAAKTLNNAQVKSDEVKLNKPSLLSAVQTKVEDKSSQDAVASVAVQQQDANVQNVTSVVVENKARKAASELSFEEINKAFSLNLF